MSAFRASTRWIAGTGSKQKTRESGSQSSSPPSRPPLPLASQRRATSSAFRPLTFRPRERSSSRSAPTVIALSTAAPPTSDPLLPRSVPTLSPLSPERWFFARNSVVMPIFAPTSNTVAPGPSSRPCETYELFSPERAGVRARGRGQRERTLCIKPRRAAPRAARAAPTHLF